MYVCACFLTLQQETRPLVLLSTERFTTPTQTAVCPHQTSPQQQRWQIPKNLIISQKCISCPQVVLICKVLLAEKKQEIMPFFVNCRYIKAKIWFQWRGSSCVSLTPSSARLPEQSDVDAEAQKNPSGSVFSASGGRRWKDLERKGRGWRDGRKNIGETKNAINCEGQRVKGRSRNRGRRWRGETRNTDRENEIKKERRRQAGVFQSGSSWTQRRRKWQEEHERDL